MPSHNRAKSKSHKSHKSHGLHRTSDERVKRAYQNNNNSNNNNNKNSTNKKQGQSNNKSIVNDEFDRELFNLKERQSGAYGRNKAKKSLVSNIVIQAPILPMNITTIDKPKSIIEELLMNEEYDSRVQTTISSNDKTDRSRHASTNIFAVLDDDDEETLKINIQPSILQLNNQKHEEDEIDPDI